LSYPDVCDVLAVGKAYSISSKLMIDSVQDCGASRLLGPVASFSINPELPDGLLIDTLNGTIRGVPREEQPCTTYTVRAVHNGFDAQRRQQNPIWEAQCSITFSVSHPPFNLQYPTVDKVFESMNADRMQNESFSVTPTVTQGSLDHFEIEPQLPKGMQFNEATGEIHGLPSADALTVSKYDATFCVFASGLLGTVATRVQLEVCSGAWNLILLRFGSELDNDDSNNHVSSNSMYAKRTFVPRPPPGAPVGQRGRQTLPGVALTPIGKVDWEIVLFKTAAVLREFGRLIPADNEVHSLYPMVKGMDVPSLLRCLGLEEDRESAVALARAVRTADEKAFREPPVLGVIDRKDETLIYLRPEPVPPSPPKAPRTPRTSRVRMQRTS
jgi:hypothetical protein